MSGLEIRVSAQYYTWPSTKCAECFWGFFTFSINTVDRLQLRFEAVLQSEVERGSPQYCAVVILILERAFTRETRLLRLPSPQGR